MILIKQNTTNNVVLTLYEYATIYPFDVLFMFKNETTGEIKYFTASDISPATERYNQFNIIENVTENLLQGTVSLDPTGYWSYTIYEMPVASPPSIDPNNAIAIMEVGKVNVIPFATIVTPTFTDDDEINNVVFDQ